MIELFVVKDTEWLELVVETVTWEGARFKAPRKITAQIVTKQGAHKYYSVNEGDTVLFKWKGAELFRGTVFNRTPKDGLLGFVAYDMLQYMVANKDVYVFSNQRADQIVRRMANDFQIPINSLTNTGHVIKSLVVKNDTSLYDIWQQAYKVSRKQNGRNFQLYSTKGKLGLRAWPDPSEVYVIESGNNLIDYSYKTSIEDTATRVKVRMEKDGRTHTAVANDNSNQKKFGVLQYTESVTDDINSGQLQERANNLQKEKKGVQEELSGIKALGITDAVSGMPIRVIIKEEGIDRNYWIDNDVHEFKGSSHTMTFDVVKQNTVPEGANA